MARKIRQYRGKVKWTNKSVTILNVATRNRPDDENVKMKDGFEYNDWDNDMCNDFLDSFSLNDFDNIYEYEY